MPKKKRKSHVALPPAAPDETQPKAVERSEEQSGDLQGLPDVADADAESVRELVEEGQFYEAEVVSGVESAAPPDSGPVKVRRRREDDVPPEYTERPPDEPKE